MLSRVWLLEQELIKQSGFKRHKFERYVDYYRKQTTVYCINADNESEYVYKIVNY